MAERYRPSNATEGDAFIAQFCGRCNKREGCGIPRLTMRHQVEDAEYPREWIREGRTGRCTSFEPVDSAERLALTLWPEWAYAVAHLGKNVENRVWAPPKNLIGSWLAIHAGKHIGGKPGDEWTLDGLRELLNMAEELGRELPTFDELIPQIKTSAVVAVAKVVGVIRQPDPLGWYNGEGSIGWKLDSIITLPEPVACKGNRGLWNLPPDVLALVRAQVKRAPQPTGAA